MPGASLAPIADPVPIQYGSHGFRQLDAGPFQITEVRLSAGHTIEPHYHERPNLGVMMEGSFDLSFRGRPSCTCGPGYLFVEPAGETHCNCMGCRGAWVLAIQPDPAELQTLLPTVGFLDAPSVRRLGPANLLARRLARELRSPDAFSGLMIEGLAAELLALAGRARSPGKGARKVPGWLRDVEAMIEATVPGRISMVEIARTAGVHATYLNRLFRARYGKSAGRYLLERRLEWAAEQLATGERSIVEISCLAGFADQSHFTRRFRDYTGQTPQGYRALGHLPSNQ